ncbi:autotransporter outer membrane beta-barrel domain-containing protein [Falsiporphyromonas endometrii]|uniref:Autotransporter outer membrane beta-barrel domain-containing protein n=1 Tax=Falsiporphyromonas endometrii TaxID=1387297 RepID=A0ABV9K8Q3_9PORP
MNATLKPILTGFLFFIVANPLLGNDVRVVEKDSVKTGYVDAYSGATKQNVGGPSAPSRFEVSGYGTINYHNYTRFDTDKYQTNKFDFERLSIYLNYLINDWMKLKAEFEFEHGGTGASMEFDSQEEAGEFEVEVEQGGEAKLERLYLEMLLHPMANLRVGRFKLHIGSAQTLDRPTQYFTVTRQEMENTLLPLGWYENGIQLFGSFLDRRFDYELSVSTGLDATGFSSRNWIKNGYQTRFEMPVAESMAYSGRLDYHYSEYKDDFMGVSAYFNNTTKNRPKKDMENTPGNLFLCEGHFSLNRPNWRLNTVLLWGTLQNSNLISRKNASLSNRLQVKRTPVGHQALGFSLEVGYNVLNLFKLNTKQSLFAFGRYDFYDTMYKVEGLVAKRPRWKRNTYTFGLNWFLNKNVVFKAEYQDRVFGSRRIDRVTSKDLGGHQHETAINIGMGYSF